jgi:hypothetical protein
MPQFVETSAFDPLSKMWWNMVRGMMDLPSRAERENKIHELKQMVDDATQKMFRRFTQVFRQDEDYVKERLGL